MTVEELLARESIRKTMATYNTAGDRLKLEEFLSVFTEDAVFESVGVPEQDAFHYQGREQIGQWQNRWKEKAKDAEVPTHQATFVRHHLSTCKIDLTGPDTAKTITYWTAYTDIGPDHCGFYRDEFRKVGDEWLIAHRRVYLDWRAPESLFTTAVSRSK